MASSRTNEHMEACRKQHFFDKKAYYTKRWDERVNQNVDVDSELLLNDEAKMSQYMLHMPYGMNSGASKAQKKDQLFCGSDRQSHKEAQTARFVVYSAKLPHRLSSINYKQQW